MGAEMSNAIEIEVRSDDDDVGMESLMFDAVVSGDSDNGPGTLTSAGVLSLYIEDATAKKITPKASEADYVALMAAIAAGGGEDGVVNPGDTVTLMTSDLFDVMDGYTASYGVSVEGDSASASASGEACHDQRADGRRGQDHRHRDGENGIVLAHPDADRVERRRAHVPCDGG